MTPATRTQEAVQARVGEPLQDWVVTRRAQGLSWKAITAELAELGCHLHPETLRGWYTEVDPALPLGRTA